MFKYIRKNRKQVGAFVGVLLMITFVASYNNGGGKDRTNDHVYGNLAGNRPINISEIEQGYRAWQMLKQCVVENMGRRTLLPIAELGEDAYIQMEQHREMFALLINEARDMGMVVNKDRVETFVRNQLPPQDIPDDADRLDALKVAVGDLLLIQDAFGRQSSDVKISQPLAQNDLARRGQQLTVKIVDIPAAAYLSHVAAPTTQQVQQQFDKFAGTIAGQVDPLTNPFGFGYKFPDRVKLQYITVSRDAVKQAVVATHPAYDWEVLARRYYNKHQDEFTAAQSQDKPSPLLPSTPSFEDVRNRVMDTVQREPIEKLTDDIQEKLLATMGGDFTAWQHQPGATQTPASSGQAYDTYAYLLNLRAQIQEQYHVAPETHDLAARYLSARDLEGLADIGRATVNGTVGFSEYVMGEAKPLQPPDKQDQPDALGLEQPSRILRDAAGNLYIFRLTDARPAEVPASLAQVRDQVIDDLRAQAAYDMAHDAAKRVLDSARTGGLAAAAAASNRKTVDVGPLSDSPRGEIPNLSLDEAGRATFLSQAFDLLIEAKRIGNVQALGLIGLPVEGKVYAAQLDQIDPEWTADEFYLSQMRSSLMVREELEQQLRRNWFNYDELVKRLDYQPVSSKSNQG